MQFHYGRNSFKNVERAQENCYLMANGLGGYSSMTLAQSLTRNDHGIFVACTKAPTNRFVVVSKVVETLCINGERFCLSSQQFVDYTKNQTGEVYLASFKQDIFPCWTYIVHGVVLKKELVMVHNENTLAIRYELVECSGKQVSLEVLPAIQFCERGSVMHHDQKFTIVDNCISANGIDMNMHCPDASYDILENAIIEEDVYYGYDARDGREAVGSYVMPVRISYPFERECTATLVFTLETKTKDIEQYMIDETRRVDQLIQQAGVTTQLGQALVKASDQFVTKRASTNTKTIMAGYPFFADWGRDTMYAIEGCCISTNRFDDTKEIFRTFVKYLRKGIMPNLFPEQGKEPMYNTVDASLLFIQALYQYYEASQDLTFVQEEMMTPMKEILEYYRKGTDYSIHMDSDGLIQAGSGLEQLTWMDIRYKDELPTPRHGKPVEVNAYWYNGLCVYIYFSKLLGQEVSFYEELVQRVKCSFMDKFWNEETQCLRDVVSGNDYDNQIRCNQIWAVSVPFSPVPQKESEAIVRTVFEKLYTPYGLRTLSCDDVQFVAEYSGSLYKRDMSYHQGTVWPFPLGSYFRAYLKVHDHSEAAKELVREQLSYFEDCLQEGCVGQIAEIYDGLYPSESRGCFAQAWSVSEILKICKEIS